MKRKSRNVSVEILTTSVQSLTSFKEFSPIATDLAHSALSFPISRTAMIAQSRNNCKHGLIVTFWNRHYKGLDTRALRFMASLSQSFLVAPGLTKARSVNSGEQDVRPAQKDCRRLWSASKCRRVFNGVGAFASTTTTGKC